VRVQDEAPVLRDARDQPGAALGGLALSADGLSGAVVVTLDNLLKGAASQAMQNLNLALGISETMGILPWPT
jgi:N-acetyl-gamma-glutamyl-phosphate reductase